VINDTKVDLNKILNAVAVSKSLIQRALWCSYLTASKLVDKMIEDKVVVKLNNDKNCGLYKPTEQFEEWVAKNINEEEFIEKQKAKL